MGSLHTGSAKGILIYAKRILLRDRGGADMFPFTMLHFFSINLSEAPKYSQIKFPGL
jgi:hypothetical protein